MQSWPPPPCPPSSAAAPSTAASSCRRRTTPAAPVRAGGGAGVGWGRRWRRCSAACGAGVPFCRCLAPTYPCTPPSPLPPITPTTPTCADEDWGIKFNYSAGEPAPEKITDKIFGFTQSISELKVGPSRGRRRLPMCCCPEPPPFPACPPYCPPMHSLLTLYLPAPPDPPLTLSYPLPRWLTSPTWTCPRWAPHSLAPLRWRWWTTPQTTLPASRYAVVCGAAAALLQGAGCCGQRQGWQRLHVPCAGLQCAASRAQHIVPSTPAPAPAYYPPTPHAGGV